VSFPGLTDEPGEFEAGFIQTISKTDDGVILIHFPIVVEHESHGS
jgi:hypothetical protein